MKRQIDTVSYVKARRAQVSADLAAGDVSSLQGQINTLSGQFSSLYNNVNGSGDVVDLLRSRIETLEGQVSALLSHVHAYSDVDQTGTTLNKTTEMPS